MRDSVLGQTLGDIADIDRIGDLVRANSLDVLQAPHTLSGIDIAMWDLLGRRFETPVYQLLGYERSEPRLPYASVLFGDTPAETRTKARGIADKGYVAAKFGWGPYGRAAWRKMSSRSPRRGGSATTGSSSSTPAPSGVADLAAATARLPALQQYRATWLEEPFVTGALDAYLTLAEQSGEVRIAGGEGSHNEDMARHDRSRRRGVHPDRCRAYRRHLAGQARGRLRAAQRGVTYVNHTFTSHLALSASLQPYAGHPARSICEYPVELKSAPPGR